MTELHDAASRRCDSLGTNGMNSESNEARVRRAIEAIWNRGDLDVADELFAPDYVNHDGVISDLVIGPEAIKISAALHRLAFPTLSVVVEELSAGEDTVVLGWTARSWPVDRPDGTHGGSNQSLKGITRSRFVDGKIVESWTECDRIGTFRNLGVLQKE
jgi:hypothetical protein